MPSLFIPVSDIKDEGLRVECTLDATDLRPEGAEAIPVKEAHIKGLLTLMGDEVLFRGQLSGAYLQACDRCLEPLELPFEVDCTWYFEADSGEPEDADDDDVWRLEGENVNLARYVWEEMALTVPSKFVCPEELPCAFRDQFRAQVSGEDDNDNVATDDTNPFLKLKNMFPGPAGDEGKE